VKYLDNLANISNIVNDNTEKDNANKEKITAVTEEPVLSPVLNKDGEKILFYNKENGNVKEISFDGSIDNLLFENNLEGLSDVKWSPNRNFVISSFKREDGSFKYYLYNYVTRKSKKLKEGIDGVSWDNQGEKIVYKYFDSKTGERSLNISEPDGENWEKLVSLSDDFRDLSFTHIPQTLFISFWNHPDAFQETSFQKKNIIKKDDPEKILTGYFGANYLWSPNGRNFLVSTVDKRGGNILKMELGNADGSSYKNLDIPTIVDKCVWSKNNREIYCALPSDISGDIVMPNDYYNEKIFTRDSFWKIDVESGEKERIIELDEIRDAYDASNLFLSLKEDILFFVDREDSRLYRLIL
jgi:hypothetical protein